MRYRLLAGLAVIGVLAAGCTSGTPQIEPSRAPSDAPTKATSERCSDTDYQNHDKACAQIWDFGTYFKVGWVNVNGFVPFEPSPNGTACSVPNLYVNEGQAPQPPKHPMPGTRFFTVTPVYEKYRYGDRNQYEGTRQAGVAFTAADGSRYVARFDYDDTFYRFARGYPLVFTPCPEWAQG